MNRLNKYFEVRHQLKTGDLIEWRSDTLVGRLIRMITKQPVNHSSLVIKFFDPCLDERRYLIEAIAHGVDLTLLSDRLLCHKGQAWWHPLRPEFDGLRSKILPWALDRKGTKYDYNGLFKQVSARVSCDARLLFCSEFYQMALSQVGILPQEGPARYPGEFVKYGIHLNPVQLL